MTGSIQRLFCFFILSLLITSCATTPPRTAIATHGALSVSGNQIVNQYGEAASLAGPSLFWSNTGWRGERYYNKKVVRHIQKEWNATIIRAAMGTEKNGGYEEDPQGNLERVERVIDAAIANGIYVIVDWHAHHAEKNREAAVEFFEHIAKKYGSTPNVIYEIYNEPLADTDWSTVIKPYAGHVIAKIRAIDPDNLIVVGTQTWSQDVDKTAENPIQGFSNIAYALHFYAGTHKQALRNKAKKALDAGIALMVTEWGSVNADGDGAIDKEETALWLEFMREHNLSHCSWALNDKREGASMLKPGTKPDGKWTDDDFTPAGLFIRDIVRNWNTPSHPGKN
jgi:aryl-phospho-beta-D-glucosidase BglC (GH1 family)